MKVYIVVLLAVCMFHTFIFLLTARTQYARTHLETLTRHEDNDTVRHRGLGLDRVGLVPAGAELKRGELGHNLLLPLELLTLISHHRLGSVEVHQLWPRGRVVERAVEVLTEGLAIEGGGKGKKGCREKSEG